MKRSGSRSSFLVSVDARTAKLLRGFCAVLGVAFLAHVAYGLVTGDITYDGGYAVIEGGRPIHVTSPAGLATGAVVFGTLGTGLLLIAYDPSLVARRKRLFLGLGIAMVAGVILFSWGLR